MSRIYLSKRPDENSRQDIPVPAAEPDIPDVAASEGANIVAECCTAVESMPLGFQDFCGIMRSVSCGFDVDILNRWRVIVTRTQVMLRERLRRMFLYPGRCDYIPTSADELVEMLNEHGLIWTDQDRQDARMLWHTFEAMRSDLEYNRRNRRADEMKVLSRVLS